MAVQFVTNDSSKGTFSCDVSQLGQRGEVGLTVGVLAPAGTGKSLLLRTLYRQAGSDVDLPVKFQIDHTTVGLHLLPSFSNGGGSEGGMITGIDMQGYNQLGEADLDLQYATLLATICNAVIFYVRDRLTESDLSHLRAFGTLAGLVGGAQGTGRPHLLVACRNEGRFRDEEHIKSHFAQQMEIQGVNDHFGSIEVFEVKEEPSLRGLNVENGPLPELPDSIVQASTNMLQHLTTLARGSCQTGELLAQKVVAAVESLNAGHAVSSEDVCNVIIRHTVEAGEGSQLKRFKDETAVLKTNPFSYGPDATSLQGELSKLSSQIETAWAQTFKDIPSRQRELALSIIKRKTAVWIADAVREVLSKQKNEHDQLRACYEDKVSKANRLLSGWVAQGSRASADSAVCKAKSLLEEFRTGTRTSQVPTKGDVEAQLRSHLTSTVRTIFEKEQVKHAQRRQSLANSAAPEINVSTGLTASCSNWNIGQRHSELYFAKCGALKPYLDDWDNILSAELVVTSTAGRGQAVLPPRTNNYQRILSFGSLSGRKTHGAYVEYNAATRSILLGNVCDGWGKGGRDLRNAFSDVTLKLQPNQLFGKQELRRDLDLSGINVPF